MTYKNMTLVGVIANKGTDDSVEVALDFEETHITETRTVSGLVVNVPQAQQGTPSKPSAPKTGRSAAQSATAKSKGKTSPTQQTEAKKKSVLRGWFE